MKAILSAALLSLAISGVSEARGQESGEQDVIHFVEKYDNAWNHKNVASVERILAPEYVYFSSKGAVSTRQEALNMLRDAKYMLASAERSETKVYKASGTAVVSSRWKGHGTYKGQEFHDDQRCSVVLIREKQEWQVLSEHCTQIVAP